MNKVLIVYNSKLDSNAIASSTVAEFNILQGKELEIEIERINLNKRNVLKYLINSEELPKVIYFYETKFTKEKQITDIAVEKIQAKFPEIKIIKYGNNIIYKPSRVPGNKLKTNVYYLYDKIIYDISSNFKLTKMYKVNSNLEIQDKEFSEFEINHAHGKRLSSSYGYFKTEGEAVEVAMKKFYKSEQEYLDKLAKITKELQDTIAKRNTEYEKINQLIGGL